MTYTIQEITDLAADVDAFVDAHPAGLMCHRTDYGAFFRQLYGYEPHYLCARSSAGHVLGVMPLQHTRHWLTGNRLVNGYGHNYGGILCDNSQIAADLADASVKLGQRLGVGRIEYMSLLPIPTQYPLHISREKVAMWVKVCQNETGQWDAIHGKSRNQVRKGQKSGCEIESGGVNRLDDFYRIYTYRMRELGTPAFPKPYLKGILERWPENARLFLVRIGGQCAGGGFLRWYKDIMEMPLAAVLEEYNPACANLFMYWEILKYAVERRMKWFDLGRCDREGPTYRFKERLGGEERPLHYCTWVPEGTKFESFSPDSPRYRRKVELWKRLPLWFTRLAGPWISKGF